MTIGLLHLGRTAAGPQLTLELARALIELGQQPAVVYSANAEIASELAALQTPTLAVRTFDNARGALTGLARLPKIAASIDAFLTAHDVSTLVVTMEQIWQGPIARRLARRRQVLLFVHDATPHTGEDGRVTRWLRDLERRHAHGAITLSDHVATTLIADGAFAAEDVYRTVHPAFDAPEASERQIRDPQQPVVGFFGRMSRYKGLDLGAQTIAELRRRGHRVRFHVAGNGIPADVPELNHPDNVLEDRWIPQEEVVDVLDNFDLMLLPYTEASQSGVLAYAMSLGIPTVVTPVGGLIEQAQDSGCAVVAAAVTPGALADEIEQLLADNEKYSRLSRAGLDAARNDYSWRRTATDVLTAAR